MEGDAGDFPWVVDHFFDVVGDFSDVTEGLSGVVDRSSAVADDRSWCRRVSFLRRRAPFLGGLRPSR